MIYHSLNKLTQGILSLPFAFFRLQYKKKVTMHHRKSHTKNISLYLLQTPQKCPLIKLLFHAGQEKLNGWNKNKTYAGCSFNIVFSEEKIYSK